MIANEGPRAWILISKEEATDEYKSHCRCRLWNPDRIPLVCIRSAGLGLRGRQFRRGHELPGGTHRVSADPAFTSARAAGRRDWRSNASNKNEPEIALHTQIDYRAVVCDEGLRLSASVDERSPERIRCRNVYCELADARILRRALGCCRRDVVRLEYFGAPQGYRLSS